MAVQHREESDLWLFIEASRSTPQCVWIQSYLNHNTASVAVINCDKLFWYEILLPHCSDKFGKLTFLYFVSSNFDLIIFHGAAFVIKL